MTAFRTIHSRRGVTILETMAALGLMAMAAVGTAQVLALCATHRQASEQLLMAQLEAANVQEQIAVMPYDRVTPESVREIKLSPETEAAIPDAELKIDLSQSSSSALPHKRIRVDVAWPAADSSRSVGLTSWKYAPPRTAVPEAAK
jgi:Tfp pilus assembly protein PilV